MLLSVTTKVDGYLQFMTVLILFVFVLAITYLVTRWIANYQKGRAGLGNLEIIETCRVAPNKYIQIVRAGEKYLVIGVGKTRCICFQSFPLLNLIFGEKMCRRAGLQIFLRR